MQLYRAGPYALLSFCFSLPSSIALAGAPALSGLAAKADSAEAAFSNPAGMARLQERELTIQTIIAKGLGDFELDKDKTSIDGGNPDSDDMPIIVPAVYYVRPLNEQWNAGFSLTIPTGFGTDYGSDWAGRYYTDSYTLVYVAFTPAVSYRVNEHLSLGLASSINYTLSDTEVSVNNIAPGVDDGRLETELDGVGVSFSVSMLYELSPATRFGVVYTSESEADLEGDLDFKNLGPVLGPILEQKGLVGADIEVENVLPQRILAGIYHEFDSGRYVTADALWMEFSEFGTSSISLDGTDLDIDEVGNFDDIWAFTVGAGFPVNAGMTYRVGAFYLSQPVDDDDRSLALALDSMWGIGAGISTLRDNGRTMDINLNLVDYGESPIDTGPSQFRGHVVGKNEDHYALMLDFAYHF